MNAILAPLIFVSLVLGLALEKIGADHHWAWAEPAVDIAVLFVFAYYLWRPPRIGGTQITRAIMLSCISIATAGELVLSACLHLYLYRSSVLPLFVPPGHVLLLLLGIVLANTKWIHFKAWIIILLLVLVVLVFQVARGHDFLSLGFLLFFFPALYWGKDRHLYAVMFSLALALELYGTWLGTWAWALKLEGFGLEVNGASPPIASGGAYAILDLLTMSAALYFSRKQALKPAASSP